jgi:hypothetical protein
MLVGLGYRLMIKGPGVKFRVQSAARVQWLGCRVEGDLYRVWGIGYRV